MTERQEKIVSLLQTNDWIKGNNLANFLGVSDRTIRNDIKSINKSAGKNLIISSKKNGYSLNKAFSKKDLPQTSVDSKNEKKSDLLKKLVQAKNGLSFSNLINSLYISDSTLSTYISEINEDISKFNNVLIRRKGDMLYLDGNEENIRLLYRDLLYREVKGNIFNLDEIANLYDSFDLLYFKGILENILKTYNYKVDEMTYPLLIIHLGVSLERIISKNTIANLNFDIREIEDNLEYKISETFFNEVGKQLNKKIPINEIAIFALTLSGKKRAHEYFVTEDKNLYKIIENLLLHINRVTGINFCQDENLLNSLYLHTKVLLDRIEHERQVNNVYLKEIKEKYPYIFELAVIACNYLENELQVRIKEDEIAFFAIHLGSAYRNLTSKRYRTILILPSGNTMANRLIGKIKTIFYEEIDLIDVYTYFESSLIEGNNIDLIINTVPISCELEIPNIEISVFFDEVDQGKILKVINTLNYKKLEANYSDTLKTLTDKGKFYSNMNFSSPEEAIKFLCDKLYKKKEVGEKYYKNVLERESYSPTSFAQGFAIPHSLNPSEIKKSSISILILDQAIEWGDYKVKIIFLLTVADTESETMKLFFSWMDNLCSDMDTFSNLIKCQDYESFMNLFCPHE